MKRLVTLTAIRRLRIASFAVISFWTTGALAQVSDSAQVPVIALLQEVRPPLAVVGTEALDFGRVNIPSGIQAGHACVYDIRAIIATRVFVSEVNSAGNLVSSVLPTPSNCEQSGQFQPARFGVTCSPNVAVTVLNSVETNVISRGLSIGKSASVDVAATQRDAPNRVIQASATGDTIVVTCPDGSAFGSTSGAFDVAIGGKLTVTEVAAAGFQTNIATITLTASY